jgi:hypothetical protein
MGRLRGRAFRSRPWNIIEMKAKGLREFIRFRVNGLNNRNLCLQRRRHDEEVKRRYTPATQPCAAGVDRLEVDHSIVAR